MNKAQDKLKEDYKQLSSQLANHKPSKLSSKYDKYDKYIKAKRLPRKLKKKLHKTPDYAIYYLTTVLTQSSSSNIMNLLVSEAHKFAAEVIMKSEAF